MEFELNDKQKEAVKALEAAFKKCKTAKVVFYCVLDSIEAYDGNKVLEVEFTPSEYSLMDLKNHGQPVKLYGYDFGSFADDTIDHFVQLKKK